MNFRAIAACAASAAVAALVAGAGVSYAATPATPAGRASSAAGRPAGASASAVYTASGKWGSYGPAGGAVARLRLPRGQYLVSAQVVITVLASSSRTSVACLIDGLGDYRGLLNVPAGPYEMVTIPVEHAISLRAARTVPVTCSASGHFEAGATVTATTVAAVHQQ